jgi:hypothetical protein
MGKGTVLNLVCMKTKEQTRKVSCDKRKTTYRRIEIERNGGNSR